MDFLRKYLSQIKTQLAGLTVSQKLLIGLLVVVMAATIFVTVTLSAKPAMVVLIDQPMTPQDINKAEMYLAGKYTYQVDGDKIMVPADEAYEIRGELFAAQALPKDTTAALDSLVRSNNLFTTDANSRRQWNYATQQTLTRMLSYFPFIQDGQVIIARGESGGIGRNAVPSTATVTVKLKDETQGLTSSQVGAIVAMVAGSVSGLHPEDINVIDGQRAYHGRSADSAMPSDLLEFKKAIEAELTAKLYTMFGDIPNVKIAVNADPDLRKRQQISETYDPKGVVTADIQNTRKTTSSSDGTNNGGEPGAKPNVGIAVTNSGSGHNTNATSNDSVTQTEARFSSVHEEVTYQPGASIKDLTASISLPRSYFVSIYRRMTHDPKADPDDDKLKPTMDAQIKLAVERAENTIGATSDDQIRVDWFDDTIIPPPPGPILAGSGFSSGNVSKLVSQYAKQAILGLVGIGVLGMMLMMVRRAVPAGADVDTGVFFGGSGGSGGKKRRAGETGDMDVSDDVYGEANQGDAVLTGIELDDETLASRKMVDEVSTMIKENPENAASLVKRWMTKGK